MMEQIDDVLIECDELQYDVQHPTTKKDSLGRSSVTTLNTEIQVIEGGSVTTHDRHNLRGLNFDPDRHLSNDGGHAADGAVAAAIMMYSPDIPSAEGRSAYDTRPSLAYYYATIETEETVKCVITTALFLAVIAAFILVAFLENPQM